MYHLVLDWAQVLLTWGETPSTVLNRFYIYFLIFLSHISVPLCIRMNFPREGVTKVNCENYCWFIYLFIYFLLGVGGLQKYHWQRIKLTKYYHKRHYTSFPLNLTKSSIASNVILSGIGKIDVVMMPCCLCSDLDDTL